MAQFRLGAALAAIALVVLVLVQLIAIAKNDQQMPRMQIHRSKWSSRADDGLFLLGAGRGDATGPVVQVEMAGYASVSQVGSGLRQRAFARSFIVADPANTDNTFIYVVLDAQSGDTAVRHGILQGLADLGGEYARYGEHNVAVSGTHSHSGVGAWFNYLLPQVTSLGFSKESYQALVDGAVLSIQRAHQNLAPGRLAFGSIDLEDANINRSPYAYDQNPAEEKAQYSANVDKTLTMLRFNRESDNKTTAVLTFFPVHGTSLYNNNTLISGDNKGVAAYLFERSAQSDSRFADGFVAGFSQSNVGDTTPNVLGAWCEDGSGQQCRYTDSTCGGKNEPCHGRGPYFREKDNGAKSCFEIGRRQYNASKALYEQMQSSSTPILGSSSVSSFHVYQDLAGYAFPSPWNSSTLKTCSAALGYSFAAGTSDGPGAFDFTQNKSSPSETNPVWLVARAAIHQPSEEQMECQAPKDILLDAGANTFPYQWEPNIVDIQVQRVGQLFIIVSTSEATTMSGRRWKAAIAKGAHESLSVSDPLVVLGAPANSYAHYCATEEEYSVQRYEGASTLYGPNTLAAYVNLTLTYLPYLGSASQTSSLPPIPAGPSPQINTNRSLSFIAPVVYDGAPPFMSFGDTLSSPDPTTVYHPGDVVNTTFVGANPRNNLRLEGTFASVEKPNPATNLWEVVRNDRDWNLLYMWQSTNEILGWSQVTLSWQIEDAYYSVDDPEPLQDGMYRMHYYGDAKNILGQIEPFEGIGGTFHVAT